MKLVSHLSPDFIPGLEVLAHSLSHKGQVSGVEWLLMTDDGELPGATLKKLWVWGFIPTVLKMDEVGKDKWIESWPNTRGHLWYSYNKLRTLLLPPGEYFYLDTDLLCMNDAREFVSLPSIAGAPDQPQRRVNQYINLGVWRVDASEDLFDECVKEAHVMMSEKLIRDYDVDGNPTSAWYAPALVAPCADQSVLNRVLMKYPGSIHWLPLKWNMPTNMVTKAPELWAPDEAIFVHFMGQVKPWQGDGHWIFEKPNDIWREYERSIA